MLNPRILQLSLSKTQAQLKRMEPPRIQGLATLELKAAWNGMTLKP